MSKPRKLKITINTPVAHFRKGQTINVDVDADGLPMEKFWRDRLKDSKIDNCISIAQPAKKALSKSSNVEMNDDKAS